MAQTQQDIRALVDDFTGRLVRMIEQSTTTRLQEAIASALGGSLPTGGRRGRTRSGTVLLGSVSVAAARPRRSGPKQLCPVPGCKNPAAPVFGMVCAKHKDVPKAKIKEYREARRKAKAKDKKAA